MDRQCLAQLELRPLSEPLRFLLSGPGLIGRKHAALLADNPNAVLSAIVAPDRARNNEFATRQGVDRFTTLEDALDQERFDAVIISTPNVNHYEQTVRCISERIPVFVEKPLTADIESAARLVKLADEGRTPILVGHHRLYSPLLQVAHEFLGSEDFGEAVSVQGTALFYKPDDYFDAGPWRAQEGGGPILINLIHEISILRYLMGEIESVTAQISHATRGFEVEDTVAVTLSFAKGALGTFLLSDVSASSKSWEMTSGENPDYPFFPTQNCYHFAGTMGSLDFPSLQVRNYAKRGKQSWWDTFKEQKLAVTLSDPLALQLQHFIEVIRGEAEPLVDVRAGYLNMVVIEAIRRAAGSGSTVSVAECMV